MSLGDGEKGTVSESTDSEDKWLPCQHCQVTHHLTWVGNEEQCLLLAVNYTLVNVQRTRNDEFNINILETE